MSRRVILAAVLVVALLLVGAAAGWWLGERGSQRIAPASTNTDANAVVSAAQKGQLIDGIVQDGSGRQVLYWHDPMVPGQKFKSPGKSPFMNMPLAPQYADQQADQGVRVSSEMMQNLGVRTGKAAVTMQTDTLEAVGRVVFDEHQVDSIQTRTAGFVEHLYVRAEGDPVSAGQKIADVYSPELLAAQHELLALTRVANVPDIAALTSAARERLRLLGMNSAEIRAVEKSGQVRRSVGVYAPATGVVRELGVREGAQVLPGQTIVQLAGLGRVWVLAELSERESARAHAGQSAQIHVDALPRASFAGKVDYIYPQLDTASRTVQLRIAVPNTKALLRPGMYAQVSLATEQREALSVPSEAVIATGTRKLVLLRQHGRFVPVEVNAANESQGRTEILSGLKAGDEVVLSGQFLIDSEASLKGVLARLDAHQPAASSNATPTSPAMPTPAASPHTASDSHAAPATAMGEGVITEVAPARGMVTISHGPIAALHWPQMSMSFKLRDPATIEKLKLGTKLKFDVKLAPEAGEYIIESVQIISGGGH